MLWFFIKEKNSPYLFSLCCTEYLEQKTREDVASVFAQAEQLYRILTFVSRLVY